MKRRFFAEEAVPLYPLAFQPSADVPAWDDTALNEVAGEPLGVERIDCGCKRCGPKLSGRSVALTSWDCVIVTRSPTAQLMSRCL